MGSVSDCLEGILLSAYKFIQSKGSKKRGNEYRYLSDLLIPTLHNFLLKKRKKRKKKKMWAVSFDKALSFQTITGPPHQP